MEQQQIKIKAKNGTVTLGGKCKVISQDGKDFSIERITEIEFRGLELKVGLAGFACLFGLDRIEALCKENEIQCSECGRWESFDGDIAMLESMKCECGNELLA